MKTLEAVDRDVERLEAVDPDEVTPEVVYRNRRSLMRQAGSLVLGAAGVAAGMAALSACAIPTSGGGSALSPSLEDMPQDTPNSIEQITNYNNYYEFSTDKETVAGLSKGFTSSPWTVAVGGMVSKPQKFSVDDLVGMFPPEERVYRMRCVEGWSMVIPWQGFPLRKLIEAAGPTAQAKYVRFESVRRPEEMPGQKSPFYPWPYVEGLRLDEAMNDLALMVTGLYGKPLPNQNGSPLRLAVPWKYGFKGIKSIVRIDLVDQQPTSLWMSLAPDEYGFYANVNPDVPHPRWSQSSERRIGETRRRRTLPFNGYAEQVAKLYDGMDLRKNY